MTQSVFHALADPTRRTVLTRLAEQGPAPLGKLTAGLDMSRQAAAKHVAVLRESGLVHTEQRGREAVCSLDATELRRVNEWLWLLADLWDEQTGSPG